jgi:hypothetical protein
VNKKYFGFIVMPSLFQSSSFPKIEKFNETIPKVIYGFRWISTNTNVSSILNMDEGKNFHFNCQNNNLLMAVALCGSAILVYSAYNAMLVIRRKILKMRLRRNVCHRVIFVRTNQVQNVD